MNEKYNVIVGGGGFAGTSAAICAARMGSKVLLIERYGFLGGMATAGLVNPFMGYKTSDGKVLIGGIFTEICDRMRQMNGMLDRAFNPEVLKFVLQEMILESGADLLLHSSIVNPIISNNKVTGLNVIGKTGIGTYTSDIVIDATGDADIAFSAGAETDTEALKTGNTQAMTLMFTIGGVDVRESLLYAKDHNNEMRFPKPVDENDVDRMMNGAIGIAGFYKHVEDARIKGELHLNQDMIFYITLPTKGHVVVNTTHISGCDPTDSKGLTIAEIEGRRQTHELFSFMKNYLPGFKDSYLNQTAVQIGIRESRRIIGKYIFSLDDVINGSKFDDCILRSAYPVDIHNPKGKGYSKDEDHLPPVGPPAGDWYEVPYRCLVPVNRDGLLVAGRCISSTHEGHSALRIMPNCAAMGQAAGIAASLSSMANVSPEMINIEELANVLKDQGAVI